MKRFICTAVVFCSISTSAFASEQCSGAEAIQSVAVGAGVGAVAGVAAVWTIGILAAPFTLGGSLVTSAGMTVAAVGLGAKGGAFYGAASEGIDCVQAGTKKVMGD